jgi:hypothetical protein
MREQRGSWPCLSRNIGYRHAVADPRRGGSGVTNPKIAPVGGGIAGSSYNHTINDPSHFLYPVLARHGFDLAAALDAGELPEFANHQSRMLLGEPALCYSRADADRLFRHVTSQFHFIGTMERFEDGMNILKTELRWPRIELRRLNVGAYERVHRRPDERQVEAIRKHNQLDQALYDLVCGRQSALHSPQASRSAA